MSDMLKQRRFSRTTSEVYGIVQGKYGVIPHSRFYHLDSIWYVCRYLIGYYLKCLARWIQGEKVTWDKSKGE